MDDWSTVNHFRKTPARTIVLSTRYQYNFRSIQISLFLSNDLIVEEQALADAINIVSSTMQLILTLSLKKLYQNEYHEGFISQ